MGAEAASEAAAEAAEEEEAERVEAAVAVVAEMQLTAEQLRVRSTLFQSATPSLAVPSAGGRVAPWQHSLPRNSKDSIGPGLSRL